MPGTGRLISLRGMRDTCTKATCNSDKATELIAGSAPGGQFDRSHTDMPPHRQYVRGCRHGGRSAAQLWQTSLGAVLVSLQRHVLQDGHHCCIGATCATADACPAGRTPLLHWCQLGPLQMHVLQDAHHCCINSNRQEPGGATTCRSMLLCCWEDAKALEGPNAAQLAETSLGAAHALPAGCCGISCWMDTQRSRPLRR
jgi:hypothetical protein